MTDVFLYRKAAGLYPADPSSYEALKAVGQGELVRVKISKPRNPKHHSRMWVLLTKVIEAGAPFPNEEALLFYIKVRLGHCDVVEGLGGHRYPMPKSISFSAMDQTAFNKFYDGAIKVISSEVLPGIEESDLLNEVNEMLKSPWENMVR